jgi:hypothetical protein
MAARQGIGVYFHVSENYQVLEEFLPRSRIEPKVRRGAV